MSSYLSLLRRESSSVVAVELRPPRAELAASNGEAKRHIAAGALRVNDSAVADETATLTGADLVDGAIKLSLGRKKHALLRVQ